MITPDKAEKLNYLRASIATSKGELEFKYATSKRMFGKQTAITTEQKNLIIKYLTLTTYILNDLPLRKQDKDFPARHLLDYLESFFKNIFGEEWLESKDLFLTQYSKLTNH